MIGREQESDVAKRTMSSDQVFALKAWTVKVEQDKFYICPTAYFDDKNRWSGPYKSLQHATNAIARKLQAEFVKRQKQFEGAG